jgi:hypothetical protein
MAQIFAELQKLFFSDALRLQPYFCSLNTFLFQFLVGQISWHTTNQAFRLAFLVCPLFLDPLLSRLFPLSSAGLTFIAVDHASSLLPDAARLVFSLCQKAEPKEPEKVLVWRYENQASMGASRAERPTNLTISVYKRGVGTVPAIISWLMISIGVGRHRGRFRGGNWWFIKVVEYLAVPGEVVKFKGYMEDLQLMMK